MEHNPLFLGNIGGFLTPCVRHHQKTKIKNIYIKVIILKLKHKIPTI